jgi:outer membrane receptor protein involved in Fe transport
MLSLAVPLGAAAEAPPVRSVGEVTVTASRAERDVLEVPGNVSVIDRDEIERSGVRTVPELLRRQSGLLVTTIGSGPAGAKVEARGFNNGGNLGSSLLVQINGRRANEADTADTDWALIPIDEIESIEIVRGPASALYGDNAVGGVINIRTRPVEGPPRATLRGRVGRYDTGQGSLRAAGTVAGVTGSLFVDGLTTSGYRHGSDFEQFDAKGSLQGSLGERVLLGVSGGYYHDERGFPGSLVQGPGVDEIAEFGRRAQDPDVVDDGSEVDRSFVQGWLEALLADDVELQIRPYWRARDDVAALTSTFESLLGEVLTFQQDTDIEKLSVGVDAQIQVDRPLFGRRNRLIVGFDFLHEAVDRVALSRVLPGVSDPPPAPVFSELQRDVYAGFLQNELNLTEALLFSAGVRFDYAALDLEIFDPAFGPPEADDPRFAVWSPRAALTYRIRPALSAYASYSRGFRLPNFDEDVPALIFPFFPDDEPRVELPDLEPQISDAFEIGAKFAGERIDAALSLYYMDVHNEITFNPGTFENENFDRVAHRGIESSLSVQILEWLTAYATYTFEDVEIREAENPALEGRSLPITPRNRGTVGLFARLPYRFEFTANANVVDERIVSNDFLREVKKLDPYATLDLLLAYRPTFGEHVDGALTFAVRNVTGTKYDDFAVKSAFGENVGFYPAATRTWEVGLMLTLRR